MAEAQTLLLTFAIYVIGGTLATTHRQRFWPSVRLLIILLFPAHTVVVPLALVTWRWLKHDNFRRAYTLAYIVIFITVVILMARSQ